MPHPARQGSPPIRWLASLGVWLGACTSPGEPGSAPVQAKTETTSATKADPVRDEPGGHGKPVVPDGAADPAVDPARAWVDPARTHVLLSMHADDAPEFEVLPIELAADPPALLPARRLPALPRADWPGHYVAVAAHGGRARWVHAGGREGAFELVARAVDESAGAATRQVEIGAVIPAAMHLVGEVAYVGAGNTVGTVDLAAELPRWQLLHERPDMEFKAYDLFVRNQDWLVAIDDEVMPMFADAFVVDAAGRATHRAGWELPGVINGHYHAAVLGRSGGGYDGTLWVVASYGIMDGHGQDLAALAIRGNALTVGSDVTINSHVMEDPPVLEEHVSRQTGKPEKLAFGHGYTPWTGLARFAPADGPARLLLAAGPRGLLVVPEPFGPSTRAEAIDVGGDCADVRVDGVRVLVLVAGPRSALLELRPTTAGLEPGPRLPLPAAYHRFVR